MDTHESHDKSKKKISEQTTEPLLGTTQHHAQREKMIYSKVNSICVCGLIFFYFYFQSKLYGIEPREFHAKNEMRKERNIEQQKETKIVF